jgi:hypothetical protein
VVASAYSSVVNGTDGLDGGGYGGGRRRMRADSWERWAGRLRKVDIG